MTRTLARGHDKMPLNPPKQNKNADALQFPKDDVAIWKTQLESGCDLEEVSSLFQDVWKAGTQQKQQAVLKKVGSHLSSHLLSPDSEIIIRCVLVELHSQCAPRHPLQRAIASLLQSHCDEPMKVVVLEHICRTIQTILSTGTQSSGCLLNGKCLRAMNYVEVLLENFSFGQQALELHLPLVLEFCVICLMSFEDGQQDSSNTMSVLIALLKTASTLLLKLSQQLHLMLTASDAGNEVRACWPEGMKSSQEKREWTEDKMSLLVKASEDLLMSSGSGMPHDATVSAAMLLIATLNITLRLHPSFSQGFIHSSQETLLDKFEGYCVSWSPFARLSLCHALLAKLPLSVMAGLEMKGKPLLVALFNLITQLSNSFTESSERYISSRTLALWTSVARECACVASVSSPLHQALLPSGQIMEALLQYIWSLWEDPIDGIRHQCREMFENIIKIYKHLQYSGGSEDFLLELSRTLLSLDSATRGRFVLLSTLSSHISPDKILQICPQLPSQLMAVMGHQALACHAGDLWGRLVALHWTAVSGNEENESTWSKTWVGPLIDTMCSRDQLALKHIAQHCLPALFQCCDKSLSFVTALLERVSEKSPSNRTLPAQLACWRCAKTHLREGFPHTQSLDHLLTSAMYHADEQVCLSALGLVCESVRTTEPPQLSHLPLLLSFVELNANSQSPGFRYPVLASFKKLFVRIRDSCYMMCKAFQKSKGFSENPDTLVVGYQKFLRSLLEQVFSVLHPLSSFQRRNFSLSLLQTLAAVFTPNQEKTAGNIPAVFEFERVVSEEQVRTLVDGLKDPFDANRLMCLELLYRLKAKKIGLDDPDFLTQCLKSFTTLACSPKSVNCTSAAFMLRLLTHFSCAEFNSLLSLQLSQATSNEEPPLVMTTLLLCQLLRKHADSASKDLVKASINTPMYGVLQSIRTIVEMMHWRPTPAAREVVRELVEISMCVSQIVSPVVCSSSPEGFLPDKSEVESCQEGVSEGVSSSGTAQSLLLCCWHSMKEISLLLGYLAGKLPVISENNEDGILLQEQLEKISEVFIHQLTEARHRGAFEMAYTGFCKLCRCLWSSSSPSLSKKPSLWIHDLLDSLQTSSLAKLLSITRRSAGLPFYVQAILTSEPSHTGYTCSKYTIKTLLKVARSGLSFCETPPTETGTAVHSQPAAVHALNILRSLYRESKLGDFVVPFIPEGIMIAIEGFSASLWPVRNSSTLLFSALVSRVFGAKRVQDEHSVENKMTSREFFTRFPTLYDFLLGQLKICAAQLSESEHTLLQPSLFPTLLLLSRLYPSPLDENYSSFTLRPFLSHLISCTSCPVWKTRVLVSRTLASLTAAPIVLVLLQELYKKMKLSDQNSLHGSLLVVSIVVREREQLLLSGPHPVDCDSMACWLLGEHLSCSYIASSHNLCGLTAQLYLDILHALLELISKTDSALSLLKQLNLDPLKTLLSDAYEYCFNKHSTESGLFSSSVIEAYFQLMLLVGHHRMEFSEALGNFSVLDLRDLLNKSVACADNRYLVRLGLKVLNSPSYNVSCVNDEDEVATRSRVLELVLTEADSELLTEVYLFLAKGCYPCNDTEYKVFFTAYQSCHLSSNTLELRLSLMQFIGHTLHSLPSNHSITDTYLTKWILYIKAVSVPTQPFEIRIAVTEQLSTLWNLAVVSPSSLPPLCTLIVTLLQDSDQDVRTQAAAAITRILPKNMVNEVECLNPSQALKWFIAHSLTKQISNELSLNVLISLASQLSQDEHTLLSTLAPHSTHPTPSQPSNPLFDEDPINDYAEDLLVLKMVVKAFQDIQPLPAAAPSQLTKLLFELVQNEKKLLVSIDSPWEDMGVFKARMKLKVLAPLFEMFRHQLSEDYPTQCFDALEKLSIK